MSTYSHVCVHILLYICSFIECLRSFNHIVVDDVNGFTLVRDWDTEVGAEQVSHYCQGETIIICTTLDMTDKNNRFPSKCPSRMFVWFNHHHFVVQKGPVVIVSTDMVKIPEQNVGTGRSIVRSSYGCWTFQWCQFPVFHDLTRLVF